MFCIARRRIASLSVGSNGFVLFKRFRSKGPDETHLEPETGRPRGGASESGDARYGRGTFAGPGQTGSASGAVAFAPPVPGGSLRPVGSGHGAATSL